MQKFLFVISLAGLTTLGLASVRPLSGKLVQESRVAGSSQALFKVDIGTAGPQRLQRLKDTLSNASSEAWWSEVGETLLVAGDAATGVHIKAAGFSLTETFSTKAGNELRVMVGAHGHGYRSLPKDFSVVVDAGRVKVIAASPAAISAMENVINNNRTEVGIFPLEPDQVVLRLAYNDDRKSISEFSKPRQRSLMKDAAGRVDLSRWWRDVQKLSGWNRHISAAGNIQARDWLRGELEAISDMEVSIQDFRVQGREAWNVLGILPGERFLAGEDQASAIARRSVIIGGHFDSISERPSSAAPGAEDNASGAAGVVELARVLAVMPRVHDVIFVAFSGEEQGLHGSAAFVEGLSTAERSRIAGVITMDMIAYARNGAQGRLGVLIETKRDFAGFARLFIEAAAQVTKLQPSTSYNPFGSDHVSFLDEGIPAILSIDADWDSYGHYHRTTDTPDKLTPELAHEILKMNAAVAAALAGQ